MTLVNQQFIGNLTPGGAGGAGAGERTVFFNPDFNAAYGEYRTRSIAGIGGHQFSFSVPDDFGELISLGIEAIPIGNFTDQDIDLVSNYHGEGENYQIHSESNITGIYSGVAGVGFDLDISSVFSDLSPGDRCGVFVDHNGIGTTIHYLQVKMVYR